MSNLFNAIGLDVGFLVVFLLILDIVLVVLLVIFKSEQRRLEKKIERLSEGTDGDSLEDAMLRIFDEYQDVFKTLDNNRRDINDIYDRMRTMIQKVGVVKYDAFKQMGGKLSSAIALLDENDNGFIINTVQSVDGCYSYVKSVKNGKPEIDLGLEEDEALEIALESGKE